MDKELERYFNKYQKNNAPPHTKVCGMNGACFLDAQSVDHILKDVVLGRHFDIKLHRHKLLKPFTHLKEMDFSKKSLIIFLILLIPLLSIFASAQYVPPNQAGPLSGSFQQTGPNTCVPTGLGVLADTSNISPWNARRIANGIITHCNANISQGINIYEGVWGLVRGVLNQSGGITGGSNSSGNPPRGGGYNGPLGGTTPNLTISINTLTRSVAHDKIVNLTGSSGRVTLHFDGTLMNATELNRTLAGPAGGVTGGGNGGGGGTAPGGIPVGVGYKNANFPLGHFIIVLGIALYDPETKPWGPGGSPVTTYRVLYWDPQDNALHVGDISADGTQIDSGMGPSKVSSNVKMHN